jgi:hypothetical protein
MATSMKQHSKLCLGPLKAMSNQHPTSAHPPAMLWLRARPPDITQLTETPGRSPSAIFFSWKILIPNRLNWPMGEKKEYFSSSH